MITYTSKETSEHSKEELVSMINFDESLTANDDWQMYVALTQYEAVITMHFVLDLESELACLSEAFQSDNLAPSDVDNALDRMYSQLERLKSEDGRSLAAFKLSHNTDEDMWQGISLEGRDDGGDGSFATNRKVLIDSVLAHSHARFDALQQHPVFRASKALEHRTWPIHDEAALATFGDGDISC